MEEKKVTVEKEEKMKERNETEEKIETEEKEEKKGRKQRKARRGGDLKLVPEFPGPSKKERKEKKVTVENMKVDKKGFPQRSITRGHTRAIYKGIDRQSHVTPDTVSIYQCVKHNRQIDTVTGVKQEYPQLNFKIIVQDLLTVYLYSQYKILNQNNKH